MAEKILRDNGEWTSVTVAPASGTTACIAMLLYLYIDLAARRALTVPGRAGAAAGSGVGLPEPPKSAGAGSAGAEAEKGRA